MTVKITFDEARSLIQRAIDEKGADYVYPRSKASGSDRLCRYFEDDGTPSCIVGHVLAYKGIMSPVTIDEYGDRLEHWNTYAGLCDLVDHSVIDVDARTLDYLSEAQMRQDDGDTWGEAKELADKEDKRVHGTSETD